MSRAGDLLERSNRKSDDEAAEKWQARAGEKNTKRADVRMGNLWGRDGGAEERAEKWRAKKGK